jgi:hypothetical protein
MGLKIVAVNWIVCLGITASGASDKQLSRGDVKKIDRICARLVDTTLGDGNWEAISPYLIKKDALRHLEVNCGDSCKGSLALKDGYFIDYWYMSPKGRIKPPRAYWNNVYAVVLRRGEKTIDSYARKFE